MENVVSKATTMTSSQTTHHVHSSVHCFAYCNTSYQSDSLLKTEGGVECLQGKACTQLR